MTNGIKIGLPRLCRYVPPVTVRKSNPDLPKPYAFPLVTEGRRPSQYRSSLIAIMLLLLLTLAMFADVFFSAKGTVLSSRLADLFYYFVHWRDFGFKELMRGNLALWNPYLY